MGIKVQLETRSGASIALLPGRSLRIGRRAEADHSFPDDKQMSGLHFAIELTDKGCRLLDLNSTNGTYLNGARVQQAALVSGDEIRAGTTTFVIRFFADKPASPPVSESGVPQPSAPVVSPPSSLPPVPEPFRYGELPSFPYSRSTLETPLPVVPAPPKPIASGPAKPRLHDLLNKDFQPLYALLDASREPSVLKVIYESKEEFQSLYEGSQGAQLAHFAPYLIRIPQKSKLVDILVQQAWSKSWGVFVTCEQPLKDLRTHFRHFLNVKLPDGKQVYFRYYDPRVLRLFLPTCLPDELNQFFGSVKHFLVEAEDPSTALHFMRGAKGTAPRELHLAPA